MKACLTALDCHRAEGSLSPLAKPESLPASTQMLSSLLSLKRDAISPLLAPFSKNGFTVPLCGSPSPSHSLLYTGLQGKWGVLLYILADCSPYAPVSLGWGWGGWGSK